MQEEKISNYVKLCMEWADKIMQMDRQDYGYRHILKRIKKAINYRVGNSSEWKLHRLRKSSRKERRIITSTVRQSRLRRHLRSHGNQLLIS